MFFLIKDVFNMPYVEHIVYRQAFGDKLRQIQNAFYFCIYFLYPLNYLEKRYINCLLKSDRRPSVHADVHTTVQFSITFLLNVCPPKPLDVAASIFAGD